MSIRVFFCFLSLCTAACSPALSTQSPGQCRYAKEAVRAASGLRGLKVRAAIPCSSLSKSEFRAYSKETLLHDVNKEQLPQEERILQLLGLIPADYDYSRCFVDALAAEAAAFYSARDNIFVLPAWTKTPKVILVHEAVHALEDQHYNISELGTSSFLFTDENLAAASLLEGSAMNIERRYIAQRPKGENIDLDMSAKLAPTEADCQLPNTLSALFNGIYSYGQFFNQQLLRRGGDALFEKSYTRVPRTTSEILNPKKYLAQISYYQAVETPRAQQAEFQNKAPRIANTFGEMVIRTLFKQYFDLKTATLASSGWAGDAFAYYLSGTTEELVWESKWETPRDSKQFFAALKKMFETLTDTSFRTEEGNDEHLLLSQSAASAAQLPLGISQITLSRAHPRVMLRIMAQSPEKQ